MPATMTPAVTLLDLSYAPGVTAALCNGVGYWLQDLCDRVEVAREDGGAQYTVYLGLRNRPVSCTCPDRHFRGGKPQCKHQRMVEELMKGW